jgi:dolichyl-phosphate beta-glucosyltransferase
VGVRAERAERAERVGEQGAKWYGPLGVTPTRGPPDALLDYEVGRRPLDLSLVIPCFNEATRIDACVEATTRYLDSIVPATGEVLVVDDGSSDGTADRVRAWTARRPDVRLVALPRNRGKGAAVREGVLAAEGDIVVFLDADLAVDVASVDDVLPPLRNGVDVAVGCRHVPGASVERPQGRMRRALGRGYLFVARALLGIPVSDVTCGFKGFKRRVAVDLFRGARCRRWGFDAEILHLAARAGYEMAEVPVTWRDGSGSRVRIPLDVLRSVKELLAVRWRSTFGAYDVAGPSRLDAGHRAAAHSAEAESLNAPEARERR